MSPIYAMIAKEWPGSCTHAQHLKEMSTELKGIARENDRQARTERNSVRNRGTKSPSFEVGDLVFERMKLARTHWTRNLLALTQSQTLEGPVSKSVSSRRRENEVEDPDVGSIPGDMADDQAEDGGQSNAENEDRGNDEERRYPVRIRKAREYKDYILCRKAQTRQGRV